MRVKPRGEGGLTSYKNGTQRPLVSLFCEINHASLTNKCLITPAVCTVPDPSPLPSAFHDFSPSTTSHDDQVKSTFWHSTSATEFSII